MATEKKWGLPVTLKDDGMHPSDSPDWWEWWYFDGDFDNGYVMAGTFHFGSPRTVGNPDARFIELAIYDPSGKKTMVRKSIPIEQCTASTEGLDVVMGPNTYKGNYDRTHLHIETPDGQTCLDLDYEALVEPYQCDDIKWVVSHARANVKGILTLEGKKIEVKGLGYHDHNWGDKLIGGDAAILDAIWPRIYVGDWTVNLSGGRHQRREDFQPYCLIETWKKEKLVATTNKGGGIGSDFQIEPTSGVKYPGKYKMWFNDPGIIEGEVNFEIKQVIENMDLLSRLKPFQRWHAGIFMGQLAYLRFRLGFEMNLKVNGEEVKDTGTCWCEYHKMA